MTNQSGDLKYTKTHEWVRRRGAPGGIEVGITDVAQRQLADITYVELPAPGQRLAAGGEAAVVESIKAAADVYAPVAGAITEVNASLAAAPEAINADPYGRGWLFRMTPDNPGEVAGLMDADQYQASLPEEH